MTKNNDTLFSDHRKMLTIAQASKWASEQTKRNVTPANISSLIKYGSIVAVSKNGSLVIHISDLKKYYKSVEARGKHTYQNKLGRDINWRLSFEQFKEAETTKHVHRLHAYKGKFIPQLVEYFLDSHIDELKTEACFAPGDILLDPFCGSGTTLVQANELGMHAIGIDVSMFNAMISNLKLSSISMTDLATATANISDALLRNEVGQRVREFEGELLNALKAFNAKFFPAPIFRRRVQKGEINEEQYGKEYAKKFRPCFYRLLRKHNVNNNIDLESNQFIDSWFLPSVKNEIDVAKRIIEETSDALLRDTLRMILSRTARSSRATTHSDLTTLSRQVTETYYCGKHSKICKPIFSMLGWWKRYSVDALKRKALFEKLRTNTMQTCLTGDSRNINIFSSLEKANGRLAALAKQKKIRGIFSSPPYVGMINYHEQHAYAYELFNLPRNDHSEIGSMKSGQGKLAREAYAEGIVCVLRNCLKYMVKDCNIFLVANDKFGLYPGIAKRANLTIRKEYKRPVLNRSEGSKGAYSETIFHLKRK